MFGGRRKREIRESCLILAGDGLTCTLRRSSARRTLALRVNEAGEVVVNAPMRMAEGAIQGFVGKHLAWIRARQRELSGRAPTWTTGARLPYLGDELVLNVVPAAGRAQVSLLETDSHTELRCAAPAERVEAVVLAWYRQQAHALLGERLAGHAARIGRPVPAFRLSNARTRWGSLSPKGVVSLNWRLIKAGWAEIDYVICHELAHFCQRNHSPAFWREVEALYPGWQAERAALRHNGRAYFRF